MDELFKLIFWYFKEVSTNVFFELHQVHIVSADSFFLQIWMSKLHSHVRISKPRMRKTHCIYNTSVPNEDVINSLNKYNKSMYIDNSSAEKQNPKQNKTKKQTKKQNKQFQRLIHISTRFELLSPFIVTKYPISFYFHIFAQFPTLVLVFWLDFVGI